MAFCSADDESPQLTAISHKTNVHSQNALGSGTISMEPSGFNYPLLKATASKSSPNQDVLVSLGAGVSLRPGASGGLTWLPSLR